jgi:hypothetical protein
MWATVRFGPRLLLNYFQFGYHLHVDNPVNANKMPEGWLKYVEGARLGRQNLYVG